MSRGGAKDASGASFAKVATVAIFAFGIFGERRNRFAFRFGPQPIYGA
jgi:hypothetical protein